MNFQRILLTLVLFAFVFLSFRWEHCKIAARNLFATSQPIEETYATVEFTPREKALVAHVRESIEKAQKGISKLNRGILKIGGMSAPKTRHLLNNLCSLFGTNYLEIGCWKGSTWISSLYGNKEAICNAVAIDNWSQFGGPKKAFENNCSRFLKTFPFRIYSADCFSLDTASLFPAPVNIYLYDGPHSALDQERAFTYYNDILDDVFIALVDDWNWKGVKEGTRTAFQKLQYEVLYEATLPALFSGDRTNWWNGFYVAVIRKANPRPLSASPDSDSTSSDREP